MARVNYSFEKRRRELDKKSKNAAKAERKAQEKASGISHANDGVPSEPLTGPNPGFDTDTPTAADPTTSQDR